MRVRDDIGLRRVDAGALLQLNDAGRLQEEQSAAAVRGVIRDRDRSAVLDVLQILALAGIKTDRFDMDRGQGEEVSLMLLLEVIEIRLMLEEVRVNRLVFQSRVRLDIIVELDNLQRDAFFLEVLRGNLQKISVRDRSRADLDGDIAGSSARTRPGPTWRPAAPPPAVAVAAAEEAASFLPQAVRMAAAAALEARARN